MKSSIPPPAIFSNRPQESGAIMLITLVTLVLVMLSALALIRSFDTSLSMAGNLAFKRDLLNRAEEGMAVAIALFDTGALADQSARESDSLGNNYKASMLASNSRGIPMVLLNETNYTASNMSAHDISDSGDASVTIRYVIDRLCTASGAATSSQCVRNASVESGSSGEAAKRASTYRPVYRISVRATGPRNTQVYLQTTIRR